jgi:ribonuclease HII
VSTAWRGSALYRIGADENGLGSRLGPLVVTAVMARVEDQSGHRLLSRRLSPTLARDLGDSKALVSHADFRLGEAWARALANTAGVPPRTPSELLESILLETPAELTSICPTRHAQQCWSVEDEGFTAPLEVVERVAAHLMKLRKRGVDVQRVRTSVACTRRINLERAAGRSRFVVDLHAMERLFLALRAEAGLDAQAVCGKVGGIGDYSRFFGPLGGRLHVELERTRRRSAYHFAGLGELHFVVDADAADPLVMLASLVGKYVRELLMARITRYYSRALNAELRASGYHDKVSDRFVEATRLFRRERGLEVDCFERAREVDAEG